MPQVRHVVLLRFPSDTPQERIDLIFDEIADLRQIIPGIVDFSHGRYSSPEGLHKGFTHGFMTTFDDVSSRDAYLPHPEHQRVVKELVELLDGGLDGAVAFDWIE